MATVMYFAGDMRGFTHEQVEEWIGIRARKGANLYTIHRGLTRGGVTAYSPDQVEQVVKDSGFSDRQWAWAIAKASAARAYAAVASRLGWS